MAIGQILDLDALAGIRSASECSRKLGWDAYHAVPVEVSSLHWEYPVGSARIVSAIDHVVQVSELH